MRKSPARSSSPKSTTSVAAKGPNAVTSRRRGRTAGPQAGDGRGARRSCPPPASTSAGSGRLRISLITRRSSSATSSAPVSPRRNASTSSRSVRSRTRLLPRRRCVGGRDGWPVLEHHGVGEALLQAGHGPGRQHLVGHDRFHPPGLGRRVGRRREQPGDVALDRGHAPLAAVGDERHVGVAPGGQVDQPRPRRAPALGERVRQQRAGVPHAPLVAQHLSPVQVAEGGVVEAGEAADRHPVGPAERQLALGGRRLAARHEPVRHHDRATAVGPRRARERSPQRGLVGDGLEVEHVPGHHRIEVRHRHHDDRRPPVERRDGDGLARPGHVAPHHHARQAHDPLAPADAHARVVVPRHGDRPRPRPPDGPQRLVEQAHGVGRWHRPVVQVAGDDDELHPLLGHDLDQARQGRPLLVDQRRAVEHPAQVPVGRVEDPHAAEDDSGV